MGKKVTVRGMRGSCADVATPALSPAPSCRVGLGETKAEVLQTMRDLREVGVDVVTLGQYLRPTEKCISSVVDRSASTPTRARARMPQHTCVRYSCAGVRPHVQPHVERRRRLRLPLAASVLEGFECHT